MKTVYTIGHSTLDFADFAERLRSFRIKTLVDVRSLPGSKRYPRFNKETLEKSLRRLGISYAHMPGLGGLRRAKKDSINTGWRNSSFRGYADYMQSNEFSEALETLIRLAKKSRSAIMCAEALPWRCHRSLIADALLIRGYKVEDIFGKGKSKPHLLTGFARVKGKTITYPEKQD